MANLKCSLFMDFLPLNLLGLLMKKYLVIVFTTEQKKLEIKLLFHNFTLLTQFHTAKKNASHTNLHSEKMLVSE